MELENKEYINLKASLEKLPVVKSIEKIEIIGNKINLILVESRFADNFEISVLSLEDSDQLFDFYFNGLSGKARNFFPPYPLFSPAPGSSEDIKTRITEWKKEDDWTVLKLVNHNQIIGICLLKRYKTDRPVSGLAISEDFQRLGLGSLLQTVINEQACLLKLEKLYVTLAGDNIASLNVHKKCGFIETGKLVPHFAYKNGIKEVDRQDIEMRINFDYRE